MHRLLFCSGAEKTEVGFEIKAGMKIICVGRNYADQKNLVEGPNNFGFYFFRLLIEEVLEVMLVERDFSMFLIFGNAFGYRSKDTECFPKVKLQSFLFSDLTSLIESHTTHLHPL